MPVTRVAEHRGTLVPRLIKEITAPADLAALPARVRTAITAHDERSEFLIRLLQLVVVIVFSSLYGLSPKTDAGTAFSPVPYVLAAYGVFTIAGLAWAHRGNVPNIGVYAMTFVDITLLMAMIWSFHVQYQQPPSFYLKAPTLLYIFIFIALRALRFQARFVVAAGIASVLGWSAMVAYAVIVGADDMMVTRNYVTYLTDNAILIGAEFDKIITIISVTAILAFAVRRGRTLLIEAVSEQVAAKELSRFFDPTVADRIRATEREINPGEGVKRQAAILNVDIRGFTSLASTMDANDVVRILSDYQERTVQIIQRHGGTIDKFMGDGIMATFGASIDDPAYAANALRAADDIIADADAWRLEEHPDNGFDPASINLAVASGEIVFGAVGSGERLEFTVIGRAVNLSAKLEKHNKDEASRSLATTEVVELAREQGYMPGRTLNTVRSTVAGTQDVTSLVILN